MKQNLFSQPDSFSLFPMLALLPVRGKVGGLARLTSSFYARYEKVQSLRDELGAANDLQTLRSLMAEEAMLKQVLDWLELRPAGEGE